MANSNGWGDGASNNNIGWGQGAVNNTIDWGAAHQTSWSGLTDIYGQAYDEDAVLYFAAFEAEGGTLSDTVKSEVSNMFISLKEASLFTKTKRLKLPLGGGGINAAIVDAKTLTKPTNFNFVNGDVDSVCGLQGDGSTKYLRDTQSPSQIFNGNYDWGGYHLEIVAAINAGDSFAFGAYDAAHGSQWAYTRRSGSSNVRTRGNLLAIEAIGSGLLSNGGSAAYNKESNTITRIYRNGILEATNTTTDIGTLSTTLMNYMAASNAGTPIGYCPAKMGCQALWSGFSNTDVATFDTIVKTFLTNIGAI